MKVPNISSSVNEIHERAVNHAATFRASEATLLDTLDEVEEKGVHVAYGYSSLFQYAVTELKLSESVTYNFIAVMRKSRELPELRRKISEGAINLSNARRISPVLNFVNQDHWLKKAETLSQRQLEKEIAKIKPTAVTPERVTYATHSTLKLELGISEFDLLRLRRVQDLLSETDGKSATLQTTLQRMTEFYLRHKDPLERAKRVIAKKGNIADSISSVKSPHLKSARVTEATADLLNDESGETVVPTSPVSRQVKAPLSPKQHFRKPIRAATLHRVNYRDGRRCTFVSSENGRRCSQTRWLHIHHLKPVRDGGENRTENLTVLCSAHHRWVHSESADSKVNG